MNSNMKQTAVEWLAEQMLHPENFNPYIEQAKEMEKEQIIETYKSGWYSGYNVAIDQEPEYENAEQYYKETFKTE